MALKASSKEMSSSWFKSLKMLTLLNLVTPVMKTNCRYFNRRIYAGEFFVLMKELDAFCRIVCRSEY